MPLEIIRNDITKVKVDAIVNAANETLLGGGGVDGAIHSAAGSELLEECRTLGGCLIGDAKITKGYNLPCKYVIHTVGPVWRGGAHREKDLLTSCYVRSLALAEKYNCKSVAFPLISAGVYGYPKEQALKIALDTIGDYLLSHDMLVYIVVFDKKSVQVGAKLFAGIQEYIDDCYAEKVMDLARRRPRSTLKAELEVADACCKNICSVENFSAGFNQKIDVTLDESFSQMLLRKIDEKGLTDAECYKKANIDRKLFSKIRSTPNYHPRKQTALAFAVALKLDIAETREMLFKAGFALSHSNKFDIIVEYFIKNALYDIYEINQVLFSFDQKLLGC